ncbi:MAG: hypothetical protein ABI830_13100 [Pseudolabrys sp.]
MTDKSDHKSIDRFNLHPSIKVLTFNFQNRGNIFDKGGAVKHAQQCAYSQMPDDWYLLIDSDICLPKNFDDLVVANLPGLDPDAVYGAQSRHDYSRLSDYRNRKNFYNYEWPHQIQGYFQLYRKKVFYKNSFDASACDLEFLRHFEKLHLLPNLNVDHLGKKGNWKGREIGSDFQIDI